MKERDIYEGTYRLVDKGLTNDTVATKGNSSGDDVRHIIIDGLCADNNDKVDNDIVIGRLGIKRILQSKANNKVVCNNNIVNTFSSNDEVMLDNDVRYNKLVSDNKSNDTIDEIVNSHADNMKYDKINVNGLSNDQFTYSTTEEDNSNVQKNDETDDKSYSYKLATTKTVVTSKNEGEVSQARSTFEEGVRYSMSQADKIEKLAIAETQQEFTSQRALAQYIGVNVRPDICAPVQLIAPGKLPTTDKERKSLKKTTKFLKETIDQGLNYVALDLKTTKLVLMTDASFANAEGMRSQLGYLVLMVDDDDNCNIVHYGSNRCKRVARSVMAAEIQALVLGFDFAFIVKDLIEEILGREVKLEALVDSKTVFDVIARDAQTSERRLQIDVLALRQSYDRGELDRIAWIPGDKNAADPLTKYVLSKTSPLYMIMTTNKFGIRPQGWAVSHERKSSCSVDSFDRDDEFVR